MNDQQQRAVVGSALWTLRLQGLTVALQSVSLVLSSVVGGMFSFLMITQMWNESGGIWMKIALAMVGILTALTIAQTVYNAAKAFGVALGYGEHPIAAAVTAGVATAVAIGAGIMMAKDMREQQEAEMASMRSGMSGEYAAWQSEMGIPTAHGGEWKVPGSRDTLRVVSPGERILKPDDAEYSRKNGLGGGGHTTIINIAEGAYIAEDVIKLIEDTTEKQFIRQMRGEVY